MVDTSYKKIIGTIDTFCIRNFNTVAVCMFIVLHACACNDIKLCIYSESCLIKYLVNTIHTSGNISTPHSVPVYTSYVHNQP